VLPGGMPAMMQHLIIGGYAFPLERTGSE